MAEAKRHRLLLQDSSFHVRDRLKRENDIHDKKLDDASSPEFSSSSNEALYDLSEMKAQLPIKKGLSRFYEGKSESFTCLSRATSIENLAKKAPNPCRRILKASKSCGTSLHSYKPYTRRIPKAVNNPKDG